MRQDPPKKRCAVYDIARIIATMLVVIGHAAYWNFDGNVAELAKPHLIYISYTAIIGKLGSWIYTFHMPLFFIISGAVLALVPMPDIKNGIQKKAKRLLLPYFACALLFMIPLRHACGIISWGDYGETLVGVLLGKLNILRHLWFLPCLFFCSVFTIVICNLPKLRHAYKCLILISIAIPLNYVSSVPHGDYFGINMVLRHLMWYVIGFSVGCYWKDIKWNKVNVAIFFICVLLCDLIAFKYLQRPNHILVVMGCLSCLGAASLIEVYWVKIMDSSLYKLLVATSFSIYLYHDPLEKVVVKLADVYHLPYTWWGCAIYATGRLVGVILVSIAIWWLWKWIMDKLSASAKRIRKETRDSA